jgi:hypothetical protein
MLIIRSKTKLILVTVVLISSVLILTKLWFREPSYGPFKQIDTYHEIQPVFDACDKNTLVTFDVDDTLITSPDAIANFYCPLWAVIRAYLKYPGLLLNRATFELMFSRILLQPKRFVFDPDIVRIIQQLQRQGCVVVGLTALETGTYGVIKHTQEWRANMLSNFGINFSRQFQDISLTMLPPKRGQYPCLYRGILCTNLSRKGKVLGTFLDYYHLKPAHIISFDDKTAELNSIAHACAQRHIPFSGYHMLGAKKLCSAWDTNRALLQLDFLMQQARWVSDKEADEILAGKPQKKPIPSDL